MRWLIGLSLIGTAGYFVWQFILVYWMWIVGIIGTLAILFIWYISREIKKDREMEEYREEMEKQERVERKKAHYISMYPSDITETNEIQDYLFYNNIYGSDLNHLLELLVYFSANREVEWLKYTIDADYLSDINQANQYGEIALVEASAAGNLQNIKFLLNNDANIESYDSNGFTALSIAVENGHENIIEFLLNKGASFAITDEILIAKITKILFGTSYKNLFEAVIDNNIDAVKFFLENGANLNSYDSDGYTALMLASKYGHKNMVKYLLDNNVDIEPSVPYGMTALMSASKNGHKNVLEYLLNNGANINASNDFSETSLMLASKNGYENVVEYLLNNGADITALNEFGQTSLLIASKYGHRNVVEILLNNDANIESYDSNDFTALMLASRNGHKNVVEYLLNNGANIEASTKDGETSLIIAIYESQIDILELLLKNNANKTYKISNMNLYDYSACIGNEDMMNTLSPYFRTKHFKTTVNKIRLDDHSENELFIDSFEDIKVTKLGIIIEYSLKNKTSSFDWLQKQNYLQKIFNTKNIKLFDKFNGKYEVCFFNDSVESELIMQLEISNKIPELFDFKEINHKKVFFFTPIKGVDIKQWEKEKMLIEDILTLPITIEQYSRTHELYDPTFSKDKLIMISEDLISVLPKKLDLEGQFYEQTNHEGGEIEFVFLDVSSEAKVKWEEKLEEINIFLGYRVSISNYTEDSNTLVLIEAIEESLPKRLNLIDNQNKSPKLLKTKVVNGNKYYYYSSLASFKFKDWENQIRSISLNTLFNKHNSVFKLIDCDPGHHDFDNNLNTNSSVVLVKELKPLLNYITKTKPTYLQDNKIFWGYGAGNLDYYTNIDATTHMMIIGATGSGKSTFINGIILSLIHNINSIGKLFLIDLKSGVEFNRYKKLDSEKVTVFSRGTKASKLLNALKEVEIEMHLRNEYMADNEIDKITTEPYFIIIDEFAQIDLMNTETMEEKKAKTEIVNTLLRISSLARAANIKLFIQTQDPSTIQPELKKHMMSRVLLKTGNSSDARQTLQNIDELEKMNINHIKFSKGRFVFEDYNNGETKLTELQFPYLIEETGKANLDYFLKYKKDVKQLEYSLLQKDLKKYVDTIINEYPYLADTLNNKSSVKKVESLPNKEEKEETPLFNFKDKYKDLGEKLGL